MNDEGKRGLYLPQSAIETFLVASQLGVDERLCAGEPNRVAANPASNGPRKSVGQDVVRAAEAHRRSHPAVPALDVLDLVMEGHTGSLADFGVSLHPTTAFGQIIAAAFDKGMAPQDWLLIDLCDNVHLVAELHRIWIQEVLPKLAARYALTSPCSPN